MEVNSNKNTDIQSSDFDFIEVEPLEISESFLNKLTLNEKKLVETLAANHPHGLLSSDLTSATGISNKSNLIHFKFRMLLSTVGLEIFTKRISRQWLWQLRRIQPLEVGQ